VNFFQHPKNLNRGIFFNNEKALAGNKVPNRQITDATGYRDLLRAGLGEKGDAHKGHSDFVAGCQRHYRAFASPPGDSFVQCDPKNPRSPIRSTPDGW
jgi:hypothetical protein